MTTRHALDAIIDQVADRLADQIAERVAAKLHHGHHGSSQRLLSLREAAAYLGRTPRSLRGLTANGLIPSVRQDRRIFFDIKDLDHWITTGKTG